MAATTITGPINNVNNDPFANKWVKFTLGQMGTDATAGALIAQSSDSVQTDASGDFTIDIWDNGESGVESILEVKVEGSRPKYVIIPQGTVSIELWDLIENYPAADADPQLPVTSELFLEKAQNLSDLSDVPQSRTNLGLGNVDNTADADKPISTATQAALDNKQDQSSILDNTTASYTVAEENKLAGIETGAEVNDPTTLVDADIGDTVQAYLEPLNTIETTITDTDVAIPTSGAVVDYAQPINQTDIWTFSNSTGESDPGSGIFRLNNGTQSSSTAIYLSKTSKSGESHDFTDLVVGAEFRITEAGSLNGHTVEVTGTFTDNGTWVSIPISVANTVGSIGNNNDALFQQVFGASSLGNQRNLTSPTTTVDSTPYTITAEDRILLIDDDTVGGDVTINIPSAATLLDGWSITIKKLGSTGDIILDPNGSETIDGDTTRTVRQKLESTCLVSDGSNWQVMFPTTPTGWAIYVDDTYTSGSPLVLTNAVRNLLTIDGNGSTTNTDFLPAGVTDFWDTTNNKIIPQKVGDAYDLRIDFSVDVPANTESITLELDIGDGSPDIPVVTRGIQFAESGAGQLVSIGFPIFALSTFLANGGKIYLTPSTGGFDIYDIQIFIKRDFSPL